jgi:hypothetical protein
MKKPPATKDRWSRSFIFNISWNNIINGPFPFWFLQSQELFMTGPEIKQLTKWHQPNLILRTV